MNYPLWIQIYTATVAAPMSAAAVGLAVWMNRTLAGGLLEGYRREGVVLMLGAFTLSLLFAAALFFAGFYRAVRQKNDALLLAATGHLIVVAPAITMLVLDYLRNAEAFWQQLGSPLNGKGWALHWSLLVWILIHVYTALAVSLADKK